MLSDRLFRCALAGTVTSLLGSFGPVAQAQTPQPAPIQVVVDARDAPHRIVHTELTFPAQPGPMTLLYPQWIPGEHGPTGPLVNVVGLRFTAGGQPLAWRRDADKMYAIQVTVPPGAASVQADFDYLNSGDTDGFSSEAAATSRLAILSWNQVLLSPMGVKSDDLTYEARLRLPTGWKFGTALPVVSTSDQNVVSFAPVSMTRLVDSPVVSGQYLRHYPLGGDKGHDHEIVLVADSPEADVLPASFVAAGRNLVAETGALYGARHYGSYHFLYVLSDRIAHFGLEHHESSQDQDGERVLLDDDRRLYAGGLLTHEFTHSWNGKYRRPAGLATGDYTTPMRGELLWVYEGLTEYLGVILEPRSRFNTPAEFRDEMAAAASQMSLTPGRSWRPLVDTAVAAQILYGAPDEWRSRRRGVDFYAEGMLLWLEVDTVIRRQSNNRRSLDDFLRRFYGGPDTTVPQVKPYVLTDVVAALNAVQPYDWQGFFTKRVYDVRPESPLTALESSGWRLVYNKTPNGAMKAFEADRGTVDLTTSLGFSVNAEGLVRDVLPGSPADKAGILPGEKISGVEGRTFSMTRLKAAVSQSGENAGPISLALLEGDFEQAASIDYHGGMRYPHLERRAAVPDLLSQITAPHARR